MYDCIQNSLRWDRCWPDLIEKEKAGKLIEIPGSFEVAVLEGGMDSGAPSVAFRFDLPDGKVVFAQTSLKLFLSAADLFKVKFGDPR